MKQDELYLRAAGEFGPALARMAFAYEADPDQRHDLLQEMHLALWRSFATLEGKCALATWVYRVCFGPYLYPMLVMIASHLFVLWQVNRRVGVREASAGARPVLDAYREELKRQSDGLSRAWLWYIPPFLRELAIALQQIQARGASIAQAPDYRVFVLIVVTGPCFCTAVWLAFSRGSARLQLEIERLDALKAE